MNSCLTLHSEAIKHFSAVVVQDCLDRAIRVMRYPHDFNGEYIENDDDWACVTLLDENGEDRYVDLDAIRFLWELYKKKTIQGYSA